MVTNIFAQTEIIPIALDRIDKDSLNRIIVQKKIEKDQEALGLIYRGIYLHYAETKFRDSAIFYALKSEECFYKTGDSINYYFTKAKLGLFSTEAFNLDIACSYYENALLYYDRTKDHKMLFHVYGGLGRIYELRNDLVKSHRYDSLAYVAVKNGKDTLGEVIFNDIAVRKMMSDDKIEESIHILKKNIQLINTAETFGNGKGDRKGWLSLELNLLARAYSQKKDYDSAIQCLKAWMQNENLQDDFYMQDLQNSYLMLMSYINLNQQDSALKYLDVFYKKTSNALNNFDPQKLNEISTRYETEKKQTQISELQNKNRLQRLTVSTQRKLNIALLSIFLLSLIIAFLVIKNILQKRKIQLAAEKQKAALEKKQAVEAERSRISSELHDDLGSGLSTIRLLSEIMKENHAGDDIETQLDKISDSSRELVQKMNEIIWALNINNDNLQSLVAYIRQYSVRTLDDVGLTCIFSMPENIPPIAIAGNERRNIFLIVKECVHNIIKHSKATGVVIKIVFAEDIGIRIHDNGVGFSFNTDEVHHFGLNNLRQRAMTLNGTVEWQQNNGTTVNIQIPLNKLLHKSAMA